VLTRLHARQEDMKDDRFKEAAPVTGGREAWKQGRPRVRRFHDDAEELALPIRRQEVRSVHGRGDQTPDISASWESR
jgi:hypothetical protein